MSTAVRLAELRLVDGADLEQQLKLIAQVGVHHLRAVGGDRERHVVLGEGAEGIAQRVVLVYMTPIEGAFAAAEIT